MHISSVRIDLCKNTFRLVALGERNKILVRKKFPRAQLLAYTANLPASRLEACTGAHFGGASYEDKVTKCGSSLPSSSNLTASQTRTTLSMPKPSLDSSKVVYCHRWGSSRSGAHPCLLARVGITNPIPRGGRSKKLRPSAVNFLGSRPSQSARRAGHPLCWWCQRKAWVPAIWESFENQRLKPTFFGDSVPFDFAQGRLLKTCPDTNRPGKTKAD